MIVVFRYEQKKHLFCGVSYRRTRSVYTTLYIYTEFRCSGRKNEENKGQRSCKFAFIVLLCVFLAARGNYVACYIFCLASFVVIVVFDVFFLLRQILLVYDTFFSLNMRVLVLSTLTACTLKQTVRDDHLRLYPLRYFRWPSLLQPTFN